MTQPTDDTGSHGASDDDEHVGEPSPDDAIDVGQSGAEARAEQD